MFWVCKMCGRSMKSEEKPNFCYFDRMDAIENISDEDAEKMGLKIREGYYYFGSKIPFEVEFPGDIRFSPFTGEPPEAVIYENKPDTFTLSVFQDQMMEEVRNAASLSDRPADSCTDTLT